jgi:hypothetical protein
MKRKRKREEKEKEIEKREKYYRLSPMERSQA